MKLAKEQHRTVAPLFLCAAFSFQSTHAKFFVVQYFIICHEYVINYIDIKHKKGQRTKQEKYQLKHIFHAWLI